MNFDFVLLDDCAFRREDFHSIHRGRFLTANKYERETTIHIKIKGQGILILQTKHTVKEVLAKIFLE